MWTMLIRYAVTIRHLKVRQIVYRVWHRLHRPQPDLRPAPGQQMPSMRWMPYARAASMTGPDAFTLLNVPHHIESAADWNHPQWPKLWLYNLHYFDDLNTGGAVQRKAWHAALIRRWIAENPPGQGNGWEPYPCSLRIVNWVQWAWAGNRLDDEAVQSLAVQTRWLAARLEYHLLGNHLWANAKALCFAGLFFGGDEGARWLEKGGKLLFRELREQILPDGGHFERSPMYHAIILADVLDLLQLARHFPDRFDARQVHALQDAAQRMRRWLQVMRHPDGDIAFFNDVTLGVAPTPAALEDYARELGLPPVASPSDGVSHLPESGFIRLQNARAVLLADVGAVAPDYIPGHAHAGTLSFELSLDGRRVLVNSGISTYENDAERLRQRGTAAHNTVQVAGRDSSEVWSAFRVARRVRTVTVEVHDDLATLCVEAQHDGYRRLGIRHQRAWRLLPDGLEVRDRLHGPEQPGVAYFHWAPATEAVTMRTDGARSTEDTTWHPGFNRNEPIRREAVAFTRDLLTEFRWKP